MYTVIIRSIFFSCLTDSQFYDEAVILIFAHIRYLDAQKILIFSLPKRHICCHYFVNIQWIFSHPSVFHNHPNPATPATFHLKYSLKNLIVSLETSTLTDENNLQLLFRISKSLPLISAYFRPHFRSFIAKLSALKLAYFTILKCVSAIGTLL